MKKCNKSLLVKTKTWLRPSDELFDFDNSYIKNFEVVTNIDGYLIKENAFNVMFIENLDIKQTDFKLMKIDIKQDFFYLRFFYEIDFTKLERIPWMVIRNMKSIKGEKDYKLSVGDVLKFGRVKLKITEIRLEDSKTKEKYIYEMERNDMLITKSEKLTIHDNVTKNLTLIQTSHIKIPSKILSSSRNVNGLSAKITTDEERTKRKKICRICLEENDSTDNSNIMLSPCKCSGSSKYIHMKCLQTWLKSKAIVNYLLTSNCNYYEIINVECEICKAYFPDTIKTKDNYYELYDFLKPKFKSYLILETMKEENLRTVFICNLDSKKQITIGRANQAEIRINDISVSRIHCAITIQGKDLYIKDMDSKYGILILFQKKKLKLLHKKTFSLQISNTILSFRYLLPFYMSWCSCFYNFGSSDKKDYQMINAKYIKPNTEIMVLYQEDDSFITENNGISKNDYEINGYTEFQKINEMGKNESSVIPNSNSDNKNIINCFDNITKTVHIKLNKLDTNLNNIEGYAANMNNQLINAFEEEEINRKKIKNDEIVEIN